MKNPWLSIVVHSPSTPRLLCVYDGDKMNKSNILNHACALSYNSRTLVQVFKGRSTNRLIAEFNNGVRL
jgi:hypothetical protein